MQPLASLSCSSRHAHSNSLPPSPSPPSHPSRPINHSQHNIFKPKPILDYLAITFDSLPPTIVSKANKGPKWQVAMHEEFDSFLTNDTWDLVLAKHCRQQVGFSH